MTFCYKFWDEKRDSESLPQPSPTLPAQPCPAPSPPFLPSSAQLLKPPSGQTMLSSIPNLPAQLCPAPAPAPAPPFQPSIMSTVGALRWPPICTIIEFCTCISQTLGELPDALPPVKRQQGFSAGCPCLLPASSWHGETVSHLLYFFLKHLFS